MARLQSHLKENNSLFYLYLWIYICFSAMNSVTLVGRFNLDVLILVHLLLIFLVAWKRTSWSLFLASAFVLYDTWQFLPTTSNSILFGFLLNLSFVIAYISEAIRARKFIITADAYFDSFAAAGRLLLLTMYFFGVFQKINTGFLDPNLSYAVVLLDYFPFFPKAIVATDFLRYSAIYATFVIETAIFFALIIPRFRYYGIVFGLCFHMFLSLNEYHSYVTFTCLSFAMHFLFLSSDSIENFKKRWAGKVFFEDKYTAYRYSFFALCACAYLVSFFSMVVYHDQMIRMKLWIPFGAMICWFAIFCDNKNRHVGQKVVPFFNPGNRVLTVLMILFFLSNFSPYIGLKNGQSVSMFSNLKVEDGKSNHLIFRKPVHLFDNLRYPVRIIYTDHPALKEYMHTEIRISPFVMEYHMANRPKYVIVYVQDGRMYDYMQGVPEDVLKEWKKPTFLFKILSFQGIVPENHRGL